MGFPELTIEGRQINAPAEKERAIWQLLRTDFDHLLQCDFNLGKTVDIWEFDLCKNIIVQHCNL